MSCEKRRSQAGRADDNLLSLEIISFNNGYTFWNGIEPKDTNAFLDFIYVGDKYSTIEIHTTLILGTDVGHRLW